MENACDERADADKLDVLLRRAFCMQEESVIHETSVQFQCLVRQLLTDVMGRFRKEIPVTLFPMHYFALRRMAVEVTRDWLQVRDSDDWNFSRINELLTRFFHEYFQAIDTGETYHVFMMRWYRQGGQQQTGIATVLNRRHEEHTILEPKER